MLALALNVLADAPIISYGAANELILKGVDCQSLIESHTSICEWKKSNEPEFVIPKIPRTCKPAGKGLVSVTISSCLPKFVKSYHHKKLVRSGANCWGTAMSFKQLSTKPRFLWSEEIVYWMNSPVCRKLEVGEDKKPGDIINVYGPEYLFESSFEKDKGYHFWDALYPNRITVPPYTSGYSGYHNFLHSETYISKDLAFGKDSPSKDDRFDFHPLNEVYGRSRDTECQENQSLEPHSREYQKSPKEIKDSRCGYFSIAYRCENIPAYFKRQELSPDEQQILKKIKSLQVIQERLFPLQTVLSHSLSVIEIKSMVKQADETAKQSLGEMKNSKLQKNHEMLLVLQYFTANGIRKSLEQARLIPATESL